MEEKQPSFISRLTAPLKRLNKTLRILIISVAAAVVVLVVVIAITSGRTEYEVLQTGLSRAEAAQATTILGDLDIPYNVEGVSSITISVPAGTRSEVLLQMQNEGYPASDTEPYNIYMEQASGMGTTDQDKRMYEQFTYEQRLAYVIEQSEKIEDAVVMVTLGSTSLYVLSGEDEPAAASIMLTLVGDEPLTAQEAESIRSMATTAIAGMEPENVTIMDNQMRTYSMTSDFDEAGGIYVTDQISLTERHQELIKEQVYTLLTPVFGAGNVTVSANVELDFDKKSTQSVTYSPPGDEENMGIIVSLQQSAERAGVDELAEGVAGFDANGAAPFYPEDLEGDTAPVYSYSQQLNAEVNEVREQIEQAQGKITALSVSIMVDAEEAWDEELENVRGLVANAVGVETEYISIMRTPFKVNEEYQRLLEEQEAAQQALEDAQGNGNLIIYIVAGALVAVLVVILIIASVKAKKQREQFEAEIERLEQEHAAATAAAAAEAELSLRERMESQENSVSAARLKDLQELAQKSPDVVAQLLRNWLTDDFK